MGGTRGRWLTSSARSIQTSAAASPRQVPYGCRPRRILAVNRCSGLLAPRFGNRPGINGVESELFDDVVDQFPPGPSSPATGRAMRFGVPLGFPLSSRCFHQMPLNTS